MNNYQPPYQLTNELISLISIISEKIGEANALQLHKPPAELRKSNRIKTIQSSLAIEGNTITQEQVTALLNDKRVLAPKKDILEVQNAIIVYDGLKNFKPFKLTSLLKAHQLLMQGLVKDAGKIRTGNVGILKGATVAHVAPPAHLVHHSLTSLFEYAKSHDDHLLIKSCAFHYELEFIHPFIDGNGRMGRLWQTLILMQKYPVFEYLPIEMIIKEEQADYYSALSQSDRSGHCTPFITFMLKVILKALEILLETSPVLLDQDRRISLFKEIVGNNTFTRKDYLKNYKTISVATASRDLKAATELGMLQKTGDKRMTVYRYTD